MALICPVTLGLSGLSSILGGEQVSEWAPPKSSCLVSLLQRPCFLATCRPSNAFLQSVSLTLSAYCVQVSVSQLDKKLLFPALFSP